MTKIKKNSKADAYLRDTPRWREEIGQLRKIALDCDLTEESKWGKPCYTFEGNNIVLIHDFKEYCAYLFFKGALLKDPHGLLVQQTENVQSARQIRFTNGREIGEKAAVLKAYILAAVAVEKAGLKVKLKKTSEFKMPEELQKRLKTDSALSNAFGALTPGRQRGYLLYFSSAKQSQTREARIEKCRPQIFRGKGWNEE